MDQPPPELPAELAELLQLGLIPGQNHSFGIMAGRCSAAQADSVARSEALMRIRDSRLYLRCAPTWKQFCPSLPAGPQ